MPMRFAHPRFWLTWLGIALLRMINLLPWRWQMLMGKWIGLTLYRALPKRRRISCINLEIAFPELDDAARAKLNRDHFISMGRGLIEAGLGWWGSDKKIQALTHTEGMEHLHQALSEGPVIIVGVHFSSLEVGGRIFARQLPLHVVYRPHQNELIEYLSSRQRAKRYGKAIPKNSIREMIKSIRQGYPAWYATDQNYRGKGYLNVPFFGVEAPTNPGTSRLAKMTSAKVLPGITVRLIDDPQNRSGYLIRALPPLKDFPGNNALEDTTRLNQILEMLIREFPDQYLWTHKRYKYPGTIDKDFYIEYLDKQPHSGCHT